MTELKSKTNEEKQYSIVIKFSNGDREYLDAGEIKITAGCLVVIDPKSYNPCEVHCYPLSQIRSFVFDFEAINNGKVEIG